jgi:uncharacterized protein YecT (DUF1311 family)
MQKQGCRVALINQEGSMYKKMIYSGIACLSFATATRAHEPDYKLTPGFSKCMDHSGTTTLGMKECISAEEKKQDARLNKAYSAAMKSLTPKRQKELKDVQRAWIKYRDAECTFLYDPDGGTLAGVVSADCFMQKTAQRATELESLTEN